MDNLPLATTIACICIIGIIVNGISLYVFNRGIVKTSTTYQLQWLAAVDTLYLCSSFIVWQMTIAMDQKIDLNDFSNDVSNVYFVMSLVEDVSYTASIWLTVFIAWYRYLAVCQPFSNRYRYVERNGQKHFVLVLILIILYNISVMCVQILVNLKLITNPKCFYEVRKYLPIVVSFAFPLIILTYVTIRLTMTLRKRRMMKRDTFHSETSNDKSIIAVLIAILVTFIICQVSVAITSICHILSVKGHINAPTVFAYFRDASMMLSVVNSAANGFIYFLCNRHFRGELIEHCAKNRRSTDIEMTPM